jgi:methylmalonyl-CoA/ethylmalonyl-CoA epimerase
MKVEKLDHIHIYVKDLDKAMARFEDLLGVEFTGPFTEFADEWGSKGAFAPPGIDLEAPTRPNSAVAKVIERSGEGLVGGVSFKVPDIESSIAELEGKGMKLLGRITMGGLKEAWFHPAGAYGVLIELCEYQGANALEASLRKTPLSQ